MSKVATGQMKEATYSDLGIEHSLCSRFKPKLRILARSAWLDELGQADAQDVCVGISFTHDDGPVSQ